MGILPQSRRDRSGWLCSACQIFSKSSRLTNNALERPRHVRITCSPWWPPGHWSGWCIVPVSFKKRTICSMANRHKYILYSSCEGTLVGSTPQKPHRLLVRGCSVWFQKLDPQHHHHLYWKHLEMQAFPGLLSNSL
jgi:hypothetical protein